MKFLKILFLLPVFFLLSKLSDAQVWYSIDSIYVDSQVTTLENVPIQIHGSIYSYEYRAGITSIKIERDTVFIFVEFVSGVDTSGFFWEVECSLAPLPVGNFVVTCTAQTQGPPHYVYYKFNNFKVVAPSGIVSDEQASKNYSLQNFPNPATNSTILKFNSDSDDYYDIIIYNANGIEVRNIKGTWFNKGDNNIPLDLTDLPGGIYVYILKGKYFFQSNKMVIKK